MGKKLAGTLFIRNGVEFGYCFEAAIRSLHDVCDHTFVVDAGSTDDTWNVLCRIGLENLTLLRCEVSDWEAQHGREKLSYFTNIAINYAQQQGYEYQFNLQGDEVLEPDSFNYIRQAINLGEEGYVITRHNLWGTPNFMLNVRQSRKPVSTQICRLTKTSYRSVDDAESVNAPASLDFINKISVWHMGFVRDSKKHVAKIKEIQGNIFQMDVDSRVVNAETFDPWAMGFDTSDVIPIHKPLPIYVRDWVLNLNK